MSALPFDRGALKARLFQILPLEVEFTELLGVSHAKKRGAWPCFNKAAHSHGDKSPSLCANTTTSAWECKTCGEKGDIFTLYMKIHGWKFYEVMRHLATKYGLGAMLSTGGTTNRSRSKSLTHISDDSIKDKIARWQGTWALKPNLATFMLVRYGLTMDTLKRWHLGVATTVDQRVWIPIWSNKSTGDCVSMLRLTSIVNVRKHDCFRHAAKWVNVDTNEVTDKAPPMELIAQQKTHPLEAFYDSDGKVISVKDHGGTYLYPFEILDENPAVYLVGGELKALLLWQVGIPAVTFTTGEGSIAEDLLIHFLGKKVRVLMDPDEAGVRAAMLVSQILSNNGAEVQRGEWPATIVEELPPKGDITDLLLKCDFNPECLDYLTWVDVEPQLADEDKTIMVRVKKSEEAPPIENMKKVRFPDLVDPNTLYEWVRVDALITGRGDVPYALPAGATVKCEEGRARWKTICASCTLPTCGFISRLELPLKAQLDLVGMHPDKAEQMILSDLGVPKKCPWPEVEITYAAAESLLLTPSVDAHVAGVDIDEFEYRHHPAIVLSNEKIKLAENKSYTISGRVVPDKTGRFLLAANHVEAIDNDILSGGVTATALQELSMQLDFEATTWEQRIERIVTDLRDHHINIYGQDRMIQTMLMSFFLPFQFRLGQYACERVCPSVMIMGATLVGKSTTAKKLLRLFGAGRLSDSSQKPTFAGLVGGNLQGSGIGGKMTFGWGLLPASHRALVVIEEANKLSLEDIGALTNLLSSGVAQRDTVNGSRRTLCHVRLLMLANPRGSRPLSSFANQMDAARGVAGTEQDLGRIEYVHIQEKLDLEEIYNTFHEPAWKEQLYTQARARTHLQWAWGLHEKDVVFQNPQHVLDQASALGRRFGNHTLLLPQQLRFKVGRIAAAFAIMSLSIGEGVHPGVVVRNEHVDMASRFLHEGYAPYMLDVSRSGSLLPNDLIKVLDQTLNVELLKILYTMESWSYQDLQAALGERLVPRFIEVCYEYGSITKLGNYYKAKDGEWYNQLAHYVGERLRLREQNKAKSYTRHEVPEAS